ncbi:unnamed protein product [Vitrella brassicaformis CCMP3155]|uniref:ATPase AAA-type core domain-containing protein n=1 Tax=Vitrella brassicaformis (strain CCMP3155) TaxID=1169540 RepID=A0A0G4EU78_VITBC|nr:unnamed protein product [Vitrella brassicaformis CCMP3155]|mmetsp:Transcript_30499/g.75709  ORF Transcript_30499/g.75709 Transcript_30499/m.75709 type:complete len:370 (-) Transcript_30499:235-1344(-)|eukprot:CEM01832.1 unnamed protein product [Vitrella brassicaformis CCMP3155]
MYTAKVYSSDHLYGKLSAFLAHVAPHAVIIASRPDYRDPAYLKITIDYGSHLIDLKEHGLKVRVEHKEPTKSMEACLILHSDTYEQNIALIDLALRSFIKAPEHRVVQIYSWEGAWHQRQAIFVADHTPSKTQQRAFDDVDWFYKNPKFYHEHSTAYQRGIILCGNAASGKHWMVRYCAHRHNKSMCYLPVTEHTYSSIGPAMACAPLNSILVLDNLVQFYQHIPSSERAVFLRHLESVFNTAVHDPRGFLVIILTPLNIPSELEKFLMMPHRFQKKFELSLSGKEALTDLLTEKLPGEQAESVQKIAAKCQNSQVPISVLQSFFANAAKEDISVDQLIQPLEQLASSIKDERNVIDAATSGNRERLYS